MKELEKAILHYQNKQFNEAIIWFSKAIDLDSNNADIFEKRGVCFVHTNQLEKAINDFTTCIALEPDNPYRYSCRAFILGKAKKVSLAIKDYEKAIQLDPTDAIAHNNLGLLYEQKGYTKEAKERFSVADELEGVKPRTPDEVNKTNIESVEDKKPLKKDEPTSKKEIIKNVFTKKKSFIEFITFIKNGFKIDK